MALLFLFGQSPLTAVLVGILMLGFYVPMSYLLDRFLHGERLRASELPNRADGAHGTPVEDAAGGGFVPPPVALVR